MEQGRRRNGNQTQIPAPRGDGLLQRWLPRKKRMRTAERSSSAARTMSSSRRTASTPTSSAARRRLPAGSCKKGKRARRGLISPRSFGMRTLTAAHRCENGENVSAKLCVRCLDIYHAQNYNKTHKKPPFAAFLRVSS